MTMPQQAKAAVKPEESRQIRIECLTENLKNVILENCEIITIPCQPGSKPEVKPENKPNKPEQKPENKPNKPEQKPENKPNKPEQKPENKPNKPEIKPENKPNKPEQKPENKPGDSVQSEHAYVLRVAELVNAERAKAGLKPLKLEKKITQAAQVRAVEIEKSFSHTRPDGTNFATALKEAGVTYRGSGENIAWGQKTPEQVMEGWMNSPGHRANILNANYTSIGVGYHQNAAGINYWSQLFIY